MIVGEMFIKQNAGIWNEELYQQEYNRLVSSIIKNKGFYIGRYESGNLSKEKVVSKPEVEDIGNKTWYKMYIAQKNIYGEDSNVKTHMIWGSQWDQILIWMKDIFNINYNVIPFYILDSTDMGVYENNRNMIYNGKTGRFKTKNIYDFAGNVWERTMEASGMTNRVNRGGSAYEKAWEKPVRYRDNSYTPNDSFDNIGSRLTLYIE